MIYLNGMEIVRVGMSAGPIDFQTFAVNSADESVLFLSSLVNVNIFPGIFVDGRNVPAVEIHQVSRASSDIRFDLKLTDEPAARFYGLH